VDGEAADVHAENGVRVLLGLRAVVGELDPAGLAASADQHLSLDHDGISERVGSLDGLLHGGCGTALRNRDAVLGEKLLSLIFE
jgi:hypothetical protein